MRSPGPSSTCAQVPADACLGWGQQQAMAHMLGSTPHTWETPAGLWTQPWLSQACRGVNQQMHCALRSAVHPARLVKLLCPF